MLMKVLLKHVVLAYGNPIIINKANRYIFVSRNLDIYSCIIGKSVEEVSVIF